MKRTMIFLFVVLAASIDTKLYAQTLLQIEAEEAQADAKMADAEAKRLKRIELVEKERLKVTRVKANREIAEFNKKAAVSDGDIAVSRKKIQEFELQRKKMKLQLSKREKDETRWQVKQKKAIALLSRTSEKLESQKGKSAEQLEKWQHQKSLIVEKLKQIKGEHKGLVKKTTQLIERRKKVRKEHQSILKDFEVIEKKVNKLSRKFVKNQAVQDKAIKSKELTELQIETTHAQRLSLKEKNELLEENIENLKAELETLKINLETEKTKSLTEMSRMQKKRIELEQSKIRLINQNGRLKSDVKKYQASKVRALKRKCTIHRQPSPKGQVVQTQSKGSEVYVMPHNKKWNKILISETEFAFISKRCI